MSRYFHYDVQPLKSMPDKGDNKILSVDSDMCHNAHHLCILNIHYVSEMFETPILYLVDMCRKSRFSEVSRQRHKEKATNVS